MQFSPLVYFLEAVKFTYIYNVVKHKHQLFCMRIDNFSNLFLECDGSGKSEVDGDGSMCVYVAQIGYKV